MNPIRHDKNDLSGHFPLWKLIPDGLILVDAKGRLCAANPSMARLLGYSKAGLYQQLFFQFTPGFSLFGWQALWAQLEADHSYLRQAAQLLKKDGSLISIKLSCQLVQVQQRTFCCCLVQEQESNAPIPQTKNQAQAEQENTTLPKLERESPSRVSIHSRAPVVNTHYNFQHIVSKSKKYKAIMRQIAQVAATHSTVLIQGETGTGKELLARAVHGLSQRASQALIIVNCAALPEHLIESELFGHEKGAFTGAHKTRIGRFELAHKGTIFLDEIGELSLEVQAKLLRILQEGEFERLGGTKPLQVDVRVIAATNRNLRALIKEGAFRKDLYYRINVFPIQNIPLRERKEDILPLIYHFLKKYRGLQKEPITEISAESLESLMSYEFPGNIRELENIVERALILSQGNTLNLEAILPDLWQEDSAKTHFQSLEEIQRQHILAALARSNWKVTGRASAAELLQINGKTLVSKMRKFGIHREKS